MKIRTTLPLEIGGTTAPAGTEIEVTEQEAADLIALGRATDAPDPAPDAEEPDAPLTHTQET